MEKVQKTIDRLWDMMEERNYPVSVMETVVGVIDWASDPVKTATKIEPLIVAAKSPKEAVKAVQQFVE
jgi:hypothetical protein